MTTSATVHAAMKKKKNNTPIAVVAVPQADRATRYLAVDAGDYRALQADRALLDAIDPIASLDDRDGQRVWGVVGARNPLSSSDERVIAAVAAIRRHRRLED